LLNFLSGSQHPAILKAMKVGDFSRVMYATADQRAKRCCESEIKLRGKAQLDSGAQLLEVQGI
jgi:hypothetical protein